MTRDVVGEALVDAKQAQQVRRGLVCRCAAHSLPEEGVEAVGLTKDHTFTGVTCLWKGFKVEQPTGKLPGRVSDCSSQICIGDEKVRPVKRAAQAPHAWQV